MVKVKNNGVYIQSIEAAMIWEHNNRKIVLDDNFTGNISHSLELIQLRKNGLDEYVKRLKPKLDENGNKVLNDKNKVILVEERIPTTEIDKRTLKSVNHTYTDDVINVKFNSKVDNLSGILKRINKKYLKKIDKVKVLYELDANKDISLLEDEIKNIEAERDNKIKKLKEVHELNSDMWDKSIGSEDLRNMMYQDGFTLTNYKGENLHYLPYKRSSAKARKGEILFIRKELYQIMSSWSRMGLEIPEDVEIDLAALSAYESLVTSSIESTIKINPKNILIISDVDSIFEQKAKVIELTTDKNGKDILHSVDKSKATLVFFEPNSI